MSAAESEPRYTASGAISHTTTRAPSTEQHGNAAPDPTPRPRDDGGLAFDDVSHGKLAPRPRQRVRQSFEVLPTARPQPGHCPPRSRQIRIAAKGKADRAKQIWRLVRYVA